MSEREQEIDKRIADGHLRHREDFETFARDQVAVQARWLNASLLAVNSGGIIATLQADTNETFALVAFIVGVGATLIGGAALQEFYRSEIPRQLRSGERYWREVSLSGMRDEEKEKEISTEMGRGSWLAYAAPGLGYFSGIAWLAGVLALGL